MLLIMALRDSGIRDARSGMHAVDNSAQASQRSRSLQLHRGFHKCVPHMWRRQVHIARPSDLAAIFPSDTCKPCFTPYKPVNISIILLAASVHIAAHLDSLTGKGKNIETSH